MLELLGLASAPEAVLRIHGMLLVLRRECKGVPNSATMKLESLGAALKVLTVLRMLLVPRRES